MRKITVLKDGWKFVKQADNAEQAVCAQSETVSLPHTWNAVDGQDGGNDYYRGTCWYVRELSGEETEGERLFLEFAGAAMSADVYLNGIKLAHHDGGYSAFRCELTGHLAEKNVLGYPSITATPGRFTHRRQTLPSTAVCIVRSA